MFEARVLRDQSGCWLWTGPLNNKGYGTHGHHRYAHRIAYSMAHGDIPDGMCVLHRCDNRKCVNPAHLFLGTIADNNTDMTAKRRNAWLLHPELVRRGEEHHMAKLTDVAVNEIRLLAAGGWPHRALAKRFLVSKSTVTRAVSGKTWKSLALKLRTAMEGT